MDKIRIFFSKCLCIYYSHYLEYSPRYIILYNIVWYYNSFCPAPCWNVTCPTCLPLFYFTFNPLLCHIQSAKTVNQKLWETSKIESRKYQGKFSRVMQVILENWAQKAWTEVAVRQTLGCTLAELYLELLKDCPFLFSWLAEKWVVEVFTHSFKSPSIHWNLGNRAPILANNPIGVWHPNPEDKLLVDHSPCSITGTTGKEAKTESQCKY